MCRYLKKKLTFLNHAVNIQVIYIPKMKLNIYNIENMQVDGGFALPAKNLFN